MRKIAAIILENQHGELLFYKRDHKPFIPFPGYWDLFGGHVEAGETIEEALIREVKEELDIDLVDYTFFREYLCIEGDVYPNVKYIFKGFINIPIENVTLLEGDYPRYFSKEEIFSTNFANIQKKIVIDYIHAK